MESPIPSAKEPRNNVIPEAVESAKSSAPAADTESAGNKKNAKLRVKTRHRLKRTFVKELFVVRLRGV